MKIFIANLPYHVRDFDIRQLFELFGRVESAKIIVEKDSGKSKGFGFLEMPDADQAQKAIERLNGTQLNDREIVIKPAEGQDSGHRMGKRPRIKL